MLIEIDHHSGVPIYKQIIEQIRYQIAGRLLKPGCKLMTVRDLAAQIKVNPMTISKAYAWLERENLLNRKRGVGLFVAELTDEQKNQNQTEIIEQNLRKTLSAAKLFGMEREQLDQLVDTIYCEQENVKGTES